MHTSRFAPPVGFLITVLAVTAAADPPNDSRFTIHVENQDVQVIAAGDTGTGRMGFKVEKKFVR